MADFGTVSFAGFWIRALAMAVDLLLLGILSVPFSIASWGASTLTLDLNAEGLAGFSALPVLYFVGFSVLAQATPGKMLFGLILVDARSGRPVEWMNHALRYICYFLSAMPMMLGFIWAGFHVRKQAWHDLLAGTVVVRKASLPVDPD